MARVRTGSRVTATQFLLQRGLDQGYEELDFRTADQARVRVRSVLVSYTLSFEIICIASCTSHTALPFINIDVKRIKNLYKDLYYP